MTRRELVDFTVQGTGPFPLDMLRFDECWPVADEDVRALEGLHFQLAIIRMRSHRGPTTGRWNSFGWRVTEVDGVKQ